MNQDFETHPLGTGRELARLNDLVQWLADSMQSIIDWQDAEDHWKFSPKNRDLMIRNCARAALQKVGR
jgi:hypothetical protein